MVLEGTLVRDPEGRLIEGPALDWSRVPARVEAVIGEHIGRLPEDLREILTLASVEGEDFTAEVAARALELDDLGTVRRLSREIDQRHRLVEARGARRIAGQRLSRYRFRHHLFQKHLYGLLEAPDRAYPHDQVGTLLEKLHGERATEISIQLARHFEEAGRAGKAVRYLREAADKAIRQSAHLEAIAHLTKGLELLELLPETEERAREELELLGVLGPLLMVVKGWAAPETEEVYSQARELAERLERPRQLLPILWGLWQSAIVRAELESSFEMAGELVGLAEGVRDSTL
jgi:predicted ATPase